jgi:ATP-dependent protease ClpP protease subunit
MEAQKGFIFKNETAETVEIDLFGDIGEGWFDEDSISMESVKEKINNAVGKDIILNISSLGGDVNHAFAIHDILKMHKGNIKANIIGMTASSGTIISMGANNIQMSENALFLVHNAWSMAVGNADDMRATANDLDVIDDRIANIYKGVTGKRKTQILSLMSEERWLTADEAKEFGFINKVFKPENMALNKIILNKINECGTLPKIDNDIINNFTKIKDMEAQKTFWDKVKNFFTVDEKELTEDEVLNVIQNREQEITDLKNQVKDLSEAKAGFDTEKETLITEHQDKVYELNNSIADLEKVKESYDTFMGMTNDFAEALKVEAKDDEALITTIQNAVAEMQTKGIKIEGSDPDLDGTKDTSVKEYLNDVPDGLKKKLKKSV